MNVVKLSDLFEINNGYASSNVELINKSEDTIYYIRPSKTYSGTIAGYVDKTEVPKRYIFPEETIYVSTDGEGSHTYTYVSNFEFVPNSNVVALIPKKEMTLREKQFYALCITKNRWKFSYGRKPKGDRLADIILPTEIPDWIYEIKEPDLSPYKEQINKYLRNKKGKLTVSSDELYYLINSGLFDNNKPFKSGEIMKTDNWKEFKLSDLFELTRGKRLKSEDREPGTVPYYSASDSNNGLTDKISNPLFTESDALIYTTFGDCYYVEGEFTASDEVTILKNDNINKYSGLFLSVVLSQDKFRWAFGRKAFMERIKQLSIRLPATKDGQPDYQYMEDYIKSLKPLLYESIENKAKQEKDMLEDFYNGND